MCFFCCQVYTIFHPSSQKSVLSNEPSPRWPPKWLPPVCLLLCTLYLSIRYQPITSKFHKCITFINLSSKFKNGACSIDTQKWMPFIHFEHYNSYWSYLSSDFFQISYTIGVDKQNLCALNCKCFLTHYFNHIFWVLKRTVSLRRFLWEPTTYVLVEK